MPGNKWNTREERQRYILARRSECISIKHLPWREDKARFASKFLVTSRARFRALFHPPWIIYRSASRRGRLIAFAQRPFPFTILLRPRDGYSRRVFRGFVERNFRPPLEVVLLSARVRVDYCLLRTIVANLEAIEEKRKFKVLACPCEVSMRMRSSLFCETHFVRALCSQFWFLFYFASPSGTVQRYHSITVLLSLSRQYQARIFGKHDIAVLKAKQITQG